MPLFILIEITINYSNCKSSFIGRIQHEKLRNPLQDNLMILR